jgi:hypothetical protein
VAVLGFLGHAGALVLPGELKVLENPWVIGVAAGLYLVEFLADKIPVVDSVWDVVHTFIRVPAASLLAWAATSSVSKEWRIVAALLCGGVALSAHGLKSSTRVALNASPEPVTNWIASLTEDGLTAFLIFLAVKYPLAAAAVAAAVVVVAIVVAAWIVRTLRRFVRSRRKGHGTGELALK